VTRPATDPESSGRHPLSWLGRPSRAVWILPGFVLAVVLVFTALGISGTSTAELSPLHGSDPSVLLGTSRTVRSDEWLVRTPMVIGQVERGFPRYAEVGVGTHDMSVLSDLPTLDWPTLFRPHQFALFLLPAANGFAFEWWASAAILLLGVYALLLVLVRDWRWAAVGAVVLYASPFFHWWYVPATFGIVGWAAAALASVLSSFNPALEGWNRWWRVGLAAYATVCFVLFLYPPWQIPVLLVLLAVGLGVTVPKVLDSSWPLRRVVVNLVVAVAGVAVFIGAFVLTRHDALSAIANTVYPGDRHETGGGGSINHLFQGWFGWEYARNDVGMRGVLFANESEASSFLFLGLVALLGLPFLWRFVLGMGRQWRASVIGLIVVMAGLLTYFFVGLPMPLARLTLLDRVTINRVLPALGLASVVFLVLLGVSMRGQDIARWRRIAAGAVVTLVGSAYVWSLGSSFQSHGAPVSGAAKVLTVLLFALPAVLYFWRPIVSLIALSLIGLAISLPANPLVRGLDPLMSSSFAHDVERIHDADTAGPAVWLTDSWDGSAVLTASGLDNLSGVNLYPDADAWRELDPTGQYVGVWNRYAHTAWTFDSAATTPVLSLVSSDVVAVRVDPCGPELTALHVRHIISTAPLVGAACLVVEAETESPNGTSSIIYTRAPS
jgi:hypothetical protein